jgi:FkbM family methyltransferase
MTALLNFIQGIRQKGLNIPVVYDIGAYVGGWSQNLATVLPESEFLLFEAHPKWQFALKQTGFRFFNCVLSNPGRSHVEYHAGGLDTGNSYYKEASPHYDNDQVLNLPCTTLDYLVEVLNLPKPNFIKLDTQGSELDILAGAEKTMQSVDLVYTECPIVKYNQGAPTIGDYIAYFESKDFVPINILDHHYCNDILIQVDIMFMRKSTKIQILGDNTHLRI